MDWMFFFITTETQIQQQVLLWWKLAADAKGLKLHMSKEIVLSCKHALNEKESEILYLSQEKCCLKQGSSQLYYYNLKFVYSTFTSSMQ